MVTERLKCLVCLKEPAPHTESSWKQSVRIELVLCTRGSKYRWRWEWTKQYLPRGTVQTINGEGVPVVRSASRVVVWHIYTNFYTSLRNVTVISCNVSNMIDRKTALKLTYDVVLCRIYWALSSRIIAGMSLASAQEKKNMQATYDCHIGNT